MQGNNAVISGTYSDFRLIKSRSVLQLVVEIPIERAEAAIEMLGVPQPGSEIHVAVARLQKPPAEPKPPDPARSEKARERYRAKSDMEKAAQRAAILCGDAGFQDWVSATTGVVAPFGQFSREDIAAYRVREHLRIASRSEIATDQRAYEAFIAMETAYKTSQGLMAEVRG